MTFYSRNEFGTILYDMVVSEVCEHLYRENADLVDRLEQCTKTARYSFIINVDGTVGWSLCSSITELIAFMSTQFSHVEFTQIEEATSDALTHHPSVSVTHTLLDNFYSGLKRITSAS